MLFRFLNDFKSSKFPVLITQRKCLASSQKPEKKTNQIKAENCLCQLGDVMFAEFREKRENHRRGGQKASQSRWDSKDTGLIVTSAYPMFIRGLWIPTNGSAPQIGPTWVLKAQSSGGHTPGILAFDLGLFKTPIVFPRHTSYTFLVSAPRWQ